MPPADTNADRTVSELPDGLWSMPQPTVPATVAEMRYSKIAPRPGFHFRDLLERLLSNGLDGRCRGQKMDCSTNGTTAFTGTIGATRS